VPNGLVQLSPDTRPDGYNDWDGCGGYHYSDSVVHGFSHTHLSGTGVADLCDVLLMPRSSRYPTFGPELFRSRFSHANEQASAGYYRVVLDDAHVTAELTATARVGVHRYTFLPDSNARMSISLHHRDKLLQGTMEQEGGAELVGERRSSSWAQDQRLFYCIRFSEPIIELRTFLADTNTVEGEVYFGPLERPLIVKVGISAVSIEGARKNLEAEMPGWDFDAARQQAEAAWNRKLGKVQVHGGSREQQRTFYTALYHTYVAPYVFNDVDGQYRGMDGDVHQSDHDVYTVFSLWDTFRALHPLMTLLEPEMTNDFIRTFLLHYQQGGRLPVWELWGNETDCMIGYHSVSVIADAYAKGVRGFDAELALEAMVASANADHFGLKEYREQGYINSRDVTESVSRTLEYAYDDWCIAQFAQALEKDSLADVFRARSRNWQNLFDPTTRFFRARRNGGFVEPFDPYEVNFHFTEANAWQYGFFAPHDLDRLQALMGGPTAFTAQLDALFEARKITTGREQADITGLIGQYAHGNEPSHHVAYLYNRSERPERTDFHVGNILRTLYADAPDGLSGNEDCGQMSAWYVWSALGLYPVTPGLPELAIGVPLFDSASMDLGAGKRLLITSEEHGRSRQYVERVTWNGRDPEVVRTLPYASLVEGGTLHFDLGPRAVSYPRPNGEWDLDGPLPAPVIQSTTGAFSDTWGVELAVIPGPWSIFYSLGPDTAQVFPYSAPFKMAYRTEVRAWVQPLHGNGRGPIVKAWFEGMPTGRTMTLGTPYANQYAAGGPQALIDGLRGGPGFQTGEWQGFRTDDVLLTIDLGKPMKVKEAALSVLQDQKSWIWFPAGVEFAFSANGRQWSSVTATHDVPREQGGTITGTISTGPIGKRARYVKVIARNAGPCPEWHPGKGGTSWIFADEVLITAE
jgi:predicted alpha-1,2-mannosidase